MLRCCNGPPYWKTYGLSRSASRRSGGALLLGNLVHAQQVFVEALEGEAGGIPHKKIGDVAPGPEVLQILDVDGGTAERCRLGPAAGFEQGLQALAEIAGRPGTEHKR